MAQHAVTSIVTGRVQGVYYRASVQREARTRGLCGWVRNLPSGDVEFLAQGEGADVDALVAWARTGPPHARVDSLQVREIDTRDDLAGFEIRY
jgi:acylphosphatase